jgi:hypothetical protein
MLEHKEQNAVLADLLARNKNTDYGRRYGFAGMQTSAQFRSRLPITGYEDYAPMVALMIRLGERNIFTCDTVTGYTLSFGQNGEAKLMPRTREFAGLFAAGKEFPGGEADTALKLCNDGLRLFPFRQLESYYHTAEALIGASVAGDECKLLCHAGFFEFAPINNGAADTAETLLANELEPGREYGVIVTNCLGLYRYRVGGSIRVLRVEGGVPAFSVLSRDEFAGSYAELSEKERSFAAPKKVAVTNARFKL